LHSTHTSEVLEVLYFTTALHSGHARMEYNSFGKGSFVDLVPSMLDFDILDFADMDFAELAFLFLACGFCDAAMLMCKTEIHKNLS